MRSKSLPSALLVAALVVAGAAAAQQRITAVYTGKERRASPAETDLALRWIEQRKLGRDYAERGLYGQLLEFDAAGRRYWTLVGFPASHRAGSLKAGERRELLLEEVPPLALLLGQDAPRPIRALPSDYRSGRLQFQYAGKSYQPALMAPALNRSSLVAYPDAGMQELSLVYGDIANVSARLRFTGLDKPRAYADFRDFGAQITLQGSTTLFMTPAELGDCRLVITRIDAGGADGSLTCRRGAATSELMPTVLQFSARP